jgi:hypothetical protein
VNNFFSASVVLLLTVAEATSGASFSLPFPKAISTRLKHAIADCVAMST